MLDKEVLSLKYQSFPPSGCKDIRIEFEARTQFVMNASGIEKHCM